MDIEPSDLIVGLLTAALGLIGLILAAGALDNAMYVFGSSLFGFACVFGLAWSAAISTGRRLADTERADADRHCRCPRSTRNYNEAVVKKFVIAAVFWAVVAFLVGVWIAAELAWPAVQPRPVVHQFRPAAPGAHLGRDLRLRRFGVVRHLVLRRAAHLPRAAVRRRGARELRVLGLPVLHRHGRAVLRDGLQPEPGIRRAGMAYRPLADHRLGRLRGRSSSAR